MKIFYSSINAYNKNKTYMHINLKFYKFYDIKNVPYLY